MSELAGNVKHNAPQRDQAAPSSDTGVDATLARHGGLSYLEIPALDAARSAAFYANVFGWNVEWRGDGDARFDDGSGYLIGRWVAGRTSSTQPGLLPYIYVSSIDAAVALVAPYGGEVVEAPRPEGNLRVATVRDPAGNLLGLWQETHACSTVAR